MGVEITEQRAYVAGLGCMSAPTYRFYPPVPPERVTALLRGRLQARRWHLRAEGAG